MDKLEEKIGYRFRDRALLLTALTHSSYANERHGDGLPCYERLEFLGDSILGLLTAEFLYRHEPPLPEGSMTRLRAELVCEQALHKVALELGIGFAPVRKPGKLPRETISCKYDLEYGSNELHMHKDAIKPGQKAVIIDDLLATGGTVAAAIKLILQMQILTLLEFK